MLLYLLDKILRIVNTRKPVELVSLKNQNHLDCGVTIIRVMTKMKFKPGQFCFLNVPSISKVEYHPFSICSSPSDDFLEFFILQTGKKTKNKRYKNKNKIK